MRKHHEWKERHERIKKNKERRGPLMKHMATRHKSIFSTERIPGEDVVEDFVAALGDESPISFLKDTERIDEDCEESPIAYTIRAANGGPIQQAMVCNILSPNTNYI